MKPEEELLNAGLGFAMEFGKNWLQPINDRLKARFPELTDEQAERYNGVCVAVMNEGREYIYTGMSRLYDAGTTMSSEDFKREFDAFLKLKYSWISEDNLSHLFSQGRYYAWRDGLDSVIV